MAERPPRTDAVIAGVNKAGTTSLFVSLSTHPDVAPSAIKETRYFLPARYGQPLEPFRRTRTTSPMPAVGRCASKHAELFLRRRRGRHEDGRAAHEPAGAA